MMTDEQAALKEQWLEQASQIHRKRGCGDDGEAWACAESSLGCAATAFKHMLDAGHDMWAMVEADKAQAEAEAQA